MTTTHHILEGSRMRGRLSVTVGANRWGQRTVRFGPTNFGDDVAEEVTINGKTYRASATVTQTDIGRWEVVDTSASLLRSPGRICGGVTPAAFRAIKAELIRVAPRYAEGRGDDYAQAVADDFTNRDEQLGELEAAVEVLARVVAERREIADDIATGALTVTPRTAQRHQVSFGPDGGLSGINLGYDSIRGAWAPVMADVVEPESGEPVAYLVAHDRRRVVVPLRQVTDQRWDERYPRVR